MQPYILYSIIFLINLYQLKKWNEIEYSISKLNQSKDSVSILINKKELLEKKFAYDIGQIISCSKYPKASYFEKVIANDFKGNPQPPSKILQTGDTGYLPPRAKKPLEITQTDEYGIPKKNEYDKDIQHVETDIYGIPIRKKVSVEDWTDEKPYYIFDSIVNISNRKLDFVDFLNVIKGIKVIDLKNTEDVLSTKKIPRSQSLERTREILFGNKNELELYTIKGVINKLPYYQKLASEPKLFLGKINGLIKNENTNIIEFNILIDRIKLLKTMLIKTSFFDFDFIKQVCMIITLALFVLLFIVRYAAYCIKSFIIYLK